MSIKSKRRPRGTLVLIFMSVPVLVILLILGTWQVQRLHWKEALIQRIEERIAAQPLPLETIISMQEQGEDIEYRPVTVSGSFVHEGERHYFATWKGATGYFVHTPLDVGGRYIFINRGFVPYDRKDASLRALGQVSGRVDIGGLSRLPETEKPSSLIPDNDLAKNVFYWRDLNAMGQSVGLKAEQVYPFFIDADDKSNAGGLPVGGVTRVEFSNKHLEYAVTWYGLAFALVVVLAGWLLRQWRDKPD